MTKTLILHDDTFSDLILQPAGEILRAQLMAYYQQPGVYIDKSLIGPDGQPVKTGSISELYESTIQLTFETQVRLNAVSACMNDAADLMVEMQQRLKTYMCLTYIAFGLITGYVGKLYLLPLLTPTAMEAPL